MSILAGYAVPHPPLIIPSVGRGEERGIQTTIDAYREIARRIVALQPETIVISSPHAPLYRDGFHVTTDEVLNGSMEAFRASETTLKAKIDTALTDEIIQTAQQSGIVVAPSTWRDRDMDHATFIPLYFIEQAYKEAGISPEYKVVRVGLSALSSEVHRQFGHAIARAIDRTQRRCVWVASGDLSHKLKADGPYGYAPEGPELDRRLCDLFRSGALEKLFELDEYFCECAAECGVRSFQIMAAALEMEYPQGVSSELLSYEGPFGVGYAVAAFETAIPEDCDVAVCNSKAVHNNTNEPLSHDDTVCSSDNALDPYVALARASVETYIKTGRALKLSDYQKQVGRLYGKDANMLPEEMLSQQAGVFVSIHEWGELRGCIGTIAPTTNCIAEEIIQNGISASTRDPRFPAIEEYELDQLEISVDVLSEAEPVSSLEELDVKRYGVIVTKGFRRGLLLPNLEGVDSVEDQVAIAKQKAGIRIDDWDVELERFEVIRHE